MAPAASPLRAPRWASPVGLVLTAAGIGVAIYLTIAHYDTHVSLTCPATSVVNCEKVTTSPQSEIFGIPVAVLGLAYYLAMIPWHLPVAWRSADPRVRFGRVAYHVAGIGFVFYLVYAEAALIKAICLWCTSVHAITLLLLIMTGLATALSFPQPVFDDDLDEDDAEDEPDAADLPPEAVRQNEG